MFRTTSNFDKLLEKATSQLLMDPDWNSIMQLCDLIRQKDVQPKHALNALKPKLTSTNQYQALYALLVLESMVKNCGYPLHEELTTRSFCDTLYELAKTTQHDKVRLKLLELIQAWNFAFRKNPKHGALKDTMNAMKSDGYKFPTFRESDAMFSADSAPEWADGDVCHRCRITFTLIQRKHHCRACGQVFCSQCSAKTTTLPKYGIEKEVRVCDSCFDQATKPTAASKAAAEKQETELPPEYVNSSLAQQSQAPPPRKTEEELREEEELQLALAISQSEAEAKEKEKFKLVNNFKSSSSSLPVAVEKTRTPSPSSGLDETTNPELAKYLDRSYWESLQNENANEHQQQQQILATSPSAPSSISNMKVMHTKQKENGVGALADNDLEDFIKTLKSQVEIFINRMKSNSSRGRSIANDTSVQTLFMNITAMHSRLFGYIQQHDDSRLHYERLQDKLTQVKDARAALDDLREEHREKLRREAEEAERLRQLQMAHKLEIMRKKKQEYLQYQRQLALQRIQEQEREMQVRQEQQKQQYLMGYNMGGFGQQVAPPQMPPNSAPPGGPGVVYGYNYGGMMPPQSAPQMGHPMGQPPQQQQGVPPGGMYQQPGGYGVQMMQPPPGLPPPPGMQPQQHPQQHPQQFVNVPPQQIPQQLPQQQQQPQSPQDGKSDAKTAELISFD